MSSLLTAHSCCLQREKIVQMCVRAYQSKQTIGRASTAVIRINFVLFHMFVILSFGLMNHFMIISQAHATHPRNMISKWNESFDIFHTFSGDTWEMTGTVRTEEKWIWFWCRSIVTCHLAKAYNSSSTVKRWWWWMERNSLNGIYSIDSTFSWRHNKIIKWLNKEINFEFLIIK